MAKRKAAQISDGGASEERPRKAAKSKSKSKDKGAARQAKSERRSKKKQHSKPERREPAPLPEADETILPDPSERTTDPFTSNNDVISLNEETPTNTTNTTNTTNGIANPAPPKSNFSTLPPSKKRSKNKPKPPNPEPKAHRFILFIGNLPYSTTTPSIEHHFRALRPFTIRHLTDKTTHKSRGTAFIEFPTYDHMKTCLKLYHHSLFDPDAHLIDAQENQAGNVNTTEKAGNSSGGGDAAAAATKKKKDQTRRINVELTAGGGGASASRKTKLREKNGRLAEQRDRAHKREAEEREKKRVEDGGRPSGVNGVALGEQGVEEGTRGNVHPSRMRRVQG
jgi:nucleolar protein 6